MSYYTRYSLAIKPLYADRVMLRQCAHEVIEGAKFCHVCGKSAAAVTLEDSVWSYISGQDEDFCYGLRVEDRCKWYEFEDDMRALSKEFPNALFVLDGKGEVASDLWRGYYVAGTGYTIKAQIIFDDFNQELLK
jgi:hypothetical protein